MKRFLTSRFDLLFIIIVIFFAVIASFPLLHKGLPPTHDGEYHVVRFYEFDKTLRGGDWYPRWAADLNHGYGIPLFNYVYPLPNYVSFAFHLLGISFISSFKLNLFFAILTGSIFFYLWARVFWGKLGGVVSSVFYTFSPYHFVDIYIRGSVGEVWALGFFPAFLWSYTKFVKSRQKIFLAYSSLCLAFIIFSHNILALMFFFFSLSYIVLLICIEKNKKYLILNTLYSILLGLGLSAIFWLPAIYEAKYVTGLRIFDIVSHFPDLYQLLIPSWGSGFSGVSIQNELSYQIGAANLLAIFLSVIVIILQIKRKDKKVYYSLFFLMWFIAILFLMLGISKPVWRLVPFMNYFQFPWRLLSLEILFASFLAGSIFSLNIKKRLINAGLVILLVFVAFVLGIGYAKPAYYMYRDDSYYLTKSNFIDGTNSIGNVFNTIWFNQNLKRQNVKITIDKGRLMSSIMKPTSYMFLVSANSESNATVNIAYFPNWTVSVDGKEIAISQDANGLISFPISKGNHTISLRFKNTQIRTVSVFLFFISLFCILFCSFKWYSCYSLKK